MKPALLIQVLCVLLLWGGLGCTDPDPDRPLDPSNNGLPDMVDGDADASGGSDGADGADGDLPEGEDLGDMDSPCPQGQRLCGDNCQDTASSLEHCGGCDQACAAQPGALVACEQSQCAWACEVGYTDLNGDLGQDGGDGCECMAQPEICDGIDNDCDGLIDEEEGAALCPDRSQATGVCGGQEGCVYTCPTDTIDANGDLQDPDGDGCECSPSGEEFCDGIDNDCDGMIDEESLANCPALTGADATRCQQGVCLYTCRDGHLDLDSDLGSPQSNGCEYRCTPSGDEACDGVDNNCDGQVDEGQEQLCPAQAQASVSCQGELGCQYQCQGAAVDVNGDLQEPDGDGCECTPTEDPTEICDDLDNDCDGLVDTQDSEDYQPSLCPLQVGACRGAVQPCLGGQPQACTAQTYREHDTSYSGSPQSTEVLCDGADNNCDGAIDELCCAQGQGAPQALLAPALPNTTQAAPAVFPTATDHLLLLTWQETQLVEDNTPPQFGTVRWALFDTNTGTVIHHGHETQGFESVQGTAAWDGLGYSVVYIDNDTDDSIIWSRYSQEGVRLRGRSGLFTATDATFSDPAVIGLGEGRNLILWLSDKCSPTSESGSCLRRAELDAVGNTVFDLPLIVADEGSSIKDMRFEPGEVIGEGLLVWREIASDSTPMIRWLRLQNETNEEGEVLFGRPDPASLGEFVYGDAGALSPLAVTRSPGGHLVVYQDVVEGVAQLFALPLQGAQSLTPVALAHSPEDDLFPAVEFVGDGYQVTWVRYFGPLRRKLMTVHLDPGGAPDEEPAEVLDALGLKYAPNALHFLPPYGVLSFVASGPGNFDPQAIQWSLLNRQGDALCLP